MGNKTRILQPCILNIAMLSKRATLHNTNTLCHIKKHYGQKRADHPKSKYVKFCRKEIKNRTDELRKAKE